MDQDHFWKYWEEAADCVRRPVRKDSLPAGRVSSDFDEKFV